MPSQCSKLLVFSAICLLALRYVSFQRVFNNGSCQNILDSCSPIASISYASLIDLNSKFYYKRDLRSIVHIPEEARVRVKLNVNATCPQPYLMGRLSGPALVKIGPWKHKSPSGVLEASYDAPVRGTYFIEIVILYCHDAFYDITNNHSDWQNDPSMNMDYSTTCAVDPNRFAMTSKNASIKVDTLRSWQTSKFGGYWWNVAQNQSTFSSYQKVSTRWQPTGCRKSKDPICTKHTEVARFQPYEFRLTFNKDRESNAGAYDDKKRDTLICPMGASHSRFLHENSVAMGMVESAINVSMAYYRAGARYPWDFSSERVSKYIHKLNCDYLVVATGQWPASYGLERPLRMGEYYKHIRAMFQNLIDTNITLKAPIYARSINYNPMKDMIVSCPPKDWRNPTVIDGYNAILRSICNDLNIPFLDANFIIGPIWDSSPDWCHLSDKGNQAEALFIASSILLNKK